MALKYKVEISTPAQRIELSLLLGALHAEWERGKKSAYYLYVPDDMSKTVEEWATKHGLSIKTV